MQKRQMKRPRPLIKSLFLKITPAKMWICGYKELKNRTFSLVPKRPHVLTHVLLFFYLSHNIFGKAFCFFFDVGHVFYGVFVIGCSH